MPSHQHFLSGLATALMPFDAFQVETAVSLWVFAHVAHRATTWSCAA